MPNYTLKDIPEDVYQRALAAAEDGCRSLNQEIIHRLKRSFDAEDARLSGLHAKWVLEALNSGPAESFSLADVDAAVNRGINRARRRNSAKA